MNRKLPIRRRWMVPALLALLTGIFLVLDPLFEGSAGHGTLLAPLAWAKEAIPEDGAPEAAEEEESSDEEDATSQTQTAAIAADLLAPPEIFVADPLLARAQALKEREDALREREAALEEQERRLEALRREIEGKLDETRRVLERMEAIALQADQEKKAELEQWVEMYQSMVSKSPEKVAEAFEDMESNQARELLLKMRPTKAAVILSHLSTEKALELGRGLAPADRANPTP